jgi:hypothetical protein
MEKFSLVSKDPARTPQMATMQRWVEKFICGTSQQQGVVGNRVDDFGIEVTQLMYDNKNRWAQVCPFIRDSLDYDHFWIEESDLDERSAEAIEQLLLKQIDDFKSCHPNYDPVAEGRGATLPILWKTFLTFFPHVRHRSGGPVPLIDDLHARMKPLFVQAGLMLGQFYAGCPVGAIYNPLWTNVLTSPYPAFAVRYMAKHDKLFIKPESPDYKYYESFFP